MVSIPRVPGAYLGFIKHLLAAEVLAEKLKTSSTTIRRRIRHLIGSGTVRIVTVVEPTLIGVVNQRK